MNRANLIKCLSDKVDPSIKNYAGKLACEVNDDDDDYDDDYDYEDEDVCKYLKICVKYLVIQ